MLPFFDIQSYIKEWFFKMNIETKNLWKKNASEVLALIDKKEISIEEVLESSLNRIKEINPDINAVVTLINEDEKKRLINNFDNSTDSILKGMPVLIKDMNDVKDMRTTYGSKYMLITFLKNQIL